MALDAAPLITRKRCLAAKLETTTGTAITLAAAEATIPVYNPAMAFNIPRITREAWGASASPVLQQPGARSGTVNFESDLMGKGASGVPTWSDWLKACAMQLSTATFSPKTSPTETLTIGLYQDGRQKVLAGCMGTWTLTARAGETARIRWQFTGVPQSPAGVSILAPTYSTVVPPRVGAATFTIGTEVFVVPEITIEKGNQVMLRRDIAAVDGASAATGHRAAYIPSWETIVRVSPEALALSSQDWYDIHRSGTTVALALTIGAAANNTIAFACPKLQLINPPQDEDQEGIMADALEFVAIRNADAGDDDLTIVFS
jgi:hypothetical protein